MGSGNSHYQQPQGAEQMLSCWVVWVQPESYIYLDFSLRWWSYLIVLLQLPIAEGGLTHYSTGCSYGNKAIQSDLKTVIQIVGVEGRHVCASMLLKSFIRHCLLNANARLQDFASFASSNAEMSSPSDNNAVVILLQIVMFLEDYQLTNTSFLQTISSLVSGGKSLVSTPVTNFRWKAIDRKHFMTGFQMMKLSLFWLVLWTAWSERSSFKV